MGDPPKHKGNEVPTVPNTIVTRVSSALGRVRMKAGRKWQVWTRRDGSSGRDVQVV